VLLRADRFVRPLSRSLGLPARLALVLACCTLTACSQQSLAIARTVRIFLPEGGAAAPLRPDRQYLRVTVQGRTILMVLGGLDHPQGAGDIETWYSGDAEVLRLQQGRILSSAGLSTDWRAVRATGLPRWDTATSAPITYERERDQMPGYRFGIREELTLRHVDAPTDSSLRDLDPRELSWFEETARALTPGIPALAPARYAVQGQGSDALAVYGEQCLAPDLCLRWQRWPARKEPQ
jgi:hypothetical protein